MTQNGVIAEQVANVTPDLVFRDKNGNAETVRFEQISAMLLNEFLQEHHAALEVRRKVEKLESTMPAVGAIVIEEAPKTKRVSARLELKKPTPQEVANR